MTVVENFRILIKFLQTVSARLRLFSCLAIGIILIKQIKEPDKVLTETQIENYQWKNFLNSDFQAKSFNIQNYEKWYSVITKKEMLYFSTIFKVILNYFKMYGKIEQNGSSCEAKKVKNVVFTAAPLKAQF